MRRMAKLTALRLSDEARKNQETRVESVKNNRTRNPASTQIRNTNQAASVATRISGQNTRGRSIVMGPPNSSNKMGNNGNSFSNGVKK